MKSFFIVFALFYYANLFGKQPDIAAYYKYINSAEISICEGNLSNSLSCYRKAYGMLGNSMPSRYLRNYFIVSVYLNEHNDERNILAELKRRGWDSISFKKMTDDFFSEKAPELTHLYYTTLKNVQTSIDFRYCDILDSLVTIDSTTNRHLRSLNAGIFNESTSDSFHKMTDENIHYLKKLFEAKFPSDSLIGSKGYASSSPRYQIILIHNSQGFQSRILDSCLFSATQSGKLDIIELEEYLENYQRGDRNFKNVVVDGSLKDVNIFPYDFMVFNDSLFEFSAPRDSMLEACNKNRLAFPGFCSAEELRTKIIFEYDHPQYSFTNRDYARELTELSSQLPQSIRKKLKYIKSKTNR